MWHALASSPPGGSACKITTWSLKGVVGNFGHVSRQGSQDDMRQGRHELLIENACMSHSILKEVSAVRSIVFKDRILSSIDSRDSKGALCRPKMMTERSQEGMRHGLG